MSSTESEQAGPGAAIELEGVSVRYGEPGGPGGADGPGGAGGPEVLRGLDLAVEPGESVAVVGPSGSGKSTLLNVIGTLARPSAGRVRVAGVDPTELDPDELARFRGRTIGFVFQSHHLLPQCTALENVLVPTLVERDAALRSRAVERARGLLEQVGLADRAGHRPGQLSGGECQRVAFVRALIREARLVLADEPAGSLDGAAADRLAELLLEVGAGQGATLVVVTHSGRLADRLGRVLALQDGRLAPAEAAR